MGNGRAHKQENLGPPGHESSIFPGYVLLYHLNFFDVGMIVAIFFKKELCGMFSLKKLDCALEESVLTCFQQSGLQTPDLLTTPNFPESTAHRGRLCSGDCPLPNSNGPFYSRRISRSSFGAIKKTHTGMLAPARSPTHPVGLGTISKPYRSPVNEGGLSHPPDGKKKKARRSKGKPCAKSHTTREIITLEFGPSNHVIAKPRLALPHGGDALNRITLHHLISLNPLIEDIIQPPQMSIPPKHQEGALQVGPARLAPRRGRPL